MEVKVCRIPNDHMVRIYITNYHYLRWWPFACSLYSPNTLFLTHRGVFCWQHCFNHCSWQRICKFLGRTRLSSFGFGLYSNRRATRGWGFGHWIRGQLLCFRSINTPIYFASFLPLLEAFGLNSNLEWEARHWRTFVFSRVEHSEWPSE